ncbi:MAG: PIG-L family deacetylase [Pirellulaceae bacterium]|nr:PIG-L family deacetylase [Pirellulaceae bacterium]
MAKTILAIGAHYDDCPFGIPGILLNAVRRNHRVVILNIIGDYNQWPPVKGRGKQLIELSVELAKERGMEMRFLEHASMGYESNLELKREIAKHVADVAPDTAYLLWPRDRHPDHEVASQAAHAALHQPARLLGQDNAKVPRQVFWFDNGPGHTIDFTPDTFVDVSDEWPGVCQWLGRLAAFVKNIPFDPLQNAFVETKSILAKYRGLACGAKYAEAVRSVRARAVDID